MAKTLQRSSQALTLTDQLQIRARAKLEMKRREMAGFRAFVSDVNPKYQWFRHNEALAVALERVARGDLKRLMIFEPPRHGKSEEVSRLFPAYIASAFPTKQIGICSYSGDIAVGFNRDAREYYLKSGGTVKDDSGEKKDWSTPQGGGVWAAGVGGSITGKGFDIGIIDDPYSGPEEAYSERIRKSREVWYDSVFATRQEPSAAIIIVMTRWHEADLAAYLLAKEKDDPQHWHIFSMEAKKEEATTVYPSTCVVEPDPREIGEALCPERYDVKALKSIEAGMPKLLWRAMYQQKPTAQEGNIWKRTSFREFDMGAMFPADGKREGLPSIVDIGNDWDLAYTEDEQNSASAFVRAGKYVHTELIDPALPKGRGNTISVTDIYILDLGFEWLEFPEMIRWMMKQPGPHYVEAKASGKSAVQTLSRNDIAAREVKVQGGNDKIGRTVLATPPGENGHVFVAKHLLEKLLDDPRQGILQFPNGAHDDLNDALVQCINRLYKKWTAEIEWI